MCANLILRGTIGPGKCWSWRPGFDLGNSPKEYTPKTCRGTTLVLTTTNGTAAMLTAARAAGLRCAMLATSHPEDAWVDADLVWRDFIGHDAAQLPWAHV